jgi:hypothetical protein
MKKILIIFLLLASSLYGDTEKKSLTLTEEGKSFWDTILSEESIKNKNLLYASYIAYKDRLNDLSIETFQECKTSNANNNMINGICEFYIGKNLFYIGKYQEAITQFSIVISYDMTKYNYLKIAAVLNTAIAYYQLGDDMNFRFNIQKVIDEDITGNYKKRALEILEIVK